MRSGAVCAISTPNVKNDFLAHFALAAAKAKRRAIASRLAGPFSEDSDEGKSSISIQSPPNHAESSKQQDLFK